MLQFITQHEFWTAVVIYLGSSPPRSRRCPIRIPPAIRATALLFEIVDLAVSLAREQTTGEFQEEMLLVAGISEPFLVI